MYDIVLFMKGRVFVNCIHPLVDQHNPFTPTHWKTSHHFHDQILHLRQQICLFAAVVPAYS